MFRDNAGAFFADDKALRVSTTAVEKAFDVQLTPIERQLLYMPFMHSESLEVSVYFFNVYK